MKVHKISDEKAGVLYLFHCPGCGYGHMYQTEAGTANKDTALIWQFNGDVNKPTFTPSLLVNASEPKSRCHLFVRDGKIQYLNDCAHHLKGQTIEMEDWDEGREA